jgi:N-acetylmuramoyl-L-alanine amidase
LKKSHFTLIAYLAAVLILGAGWKDKTLAEGDKPQVVIDPGHGGSDAGSQDGSEVEKDWNLKFALALDKAFEADGYQVLMTRTSDVTVDSEARVNMINSSNAKAVLVIHADREWTRTQNGLFLVVEPPNQNALTTSDSVQPLGAISQAQYHASFKLALDIGQKFGANTSLSDLSDSRGTGIEAVSPYGRIACLPHQDLRYLSKPAVVLTPLFLTSDSDLKKFSDSAALDQFALKVAQGVSNYLQIAPTAAAAGASK